MKRTILRFKESVSARHYEVFYKDVLKCLTRFHIKRLERKKCWDIEIIDAEEIEKILDEQYYKKINCEKKELDEFYDIEKHIPFID